MSCFTFRPCSDRLLTRWVTSWDGLMLFQVQRNKVWATLVSFCQIWCSTAKSEYSPSVLCFQVLCVRDTLNDILFTLGNESCHAGEPSTRVTYSRIKEYAVVWASSPEIWRHRFWRSAPKASKRGFLSLFVCRGWVMHLSGVQKARSLSIYADPTIQITNSAIFPSLFIVGMRILAQYHCGMPLKHIMVLVNSFPSRSTSCPKLTGVLRTGEE